MQYRPFGTTGFQVSALGFGRMRLALCGPGAGDIDEPLAVRMLRTAIDAGVSKYPPAEPGALRALAPQRGLTARGGPSEYTIGTLLRLVNHCHTVRSFRNSTLPELSNFGSPPAEPGVYPGEIKFGTTG